MNKTNASSIKKKKTREISNKIRQLASMLEQSLQQILIFISQNVFSIRRLKEKKKFYYIMNIYKLAYGDISWRSTVTRGRTGSFTDRWTDPPIFVPPMRRRVSISSAASDRSWRNANEAGMRATPLEKSRRIVETPLDRVSRLIG